MQTIVLLAAAAVIPSLAPSYGIPPPPRDAHEIHSRLARLEARQDAFQGYRSVGYFTNWVVYDPISYLINDIPIDRYTHIVYSFANMSDDGTVFLSDDWADTQMPYDGQFAAEGDLGGNLEQLYLLKKQNRHLKTMLSIGGWSYRHVFERIVDPAWRAKFVETSVKLILDLGMDGLDIDYEWANENSKDGTASLIVELRAGLDEAASQIGASRLLLSYAAPCTVAFKNLDIPRMDQAVDFWNLMAYEFAGGATPQTKPSANLYDDPSPRTSGISGKRCADYYVKQGATPRKLNVGAPLYAAAWNGTQGMYTDWTSRGDGDYGTGGFYDVKSFPLDRETVYYDESLGASWSYNSNTGHLTSFDIPQVALQKTLYVIDNQLGGMMWWAVDEDYTETSQTKRGRNQKRGRKAKRTCKKKGLETGVLALNPEASASPSASSSGFTASLSGASASASSAPSASQDALATPSASASDSDFAPTEASASVASPSSLATNSGTYFAVDTSLASLHNTVMSASGVSDSPSATVDAVSASSITAAPPSPSTSSTDTATPSSTAATVTSADPSNPFASTNPHATDQLQTSVDGIDVSMRRSLVSVSKEAIEKYSSEGIDMSENVLSFPSSQYPNVRNGMA